MTLDQFWRANLNQPASPVKSSAKKVAVLDRVVGSDLGCDDPDEDDLDEEEMDRYLEWLESTNPADIRMK